MGYTKYGEFMRVLRVKHREVMGDLAKLFDVKVPFISAVESGKRNVPDNWIPLIISHYQLSEEEQRELQEAIAESKTQIKMDLTGAGSPQRRLAIQFQRSFDNLDDKTAEALMKLLQQQEDQ